MDKHELAVFKAQAQAELNRLEAQSTAKDVAGKAIGKHGLLYITVIIVVGVGASVVLEESKIAAVIGLVSAALTALIAMISGNGLDVDKGQGKYGWYFIRCARNGAFSLRWCKQVGPKVLSFEAGWLLDVYVKDAQYAKQAPLATFQFQPQIKTAKA